MCKKNSNFVRLNFLSMPKQNTALLLRQYVWLLDTINSAGSISRQELNSRWSRASINDCKANISERSFHRYKNEIFDLFGIIIFYSKSRGYYIENSQDIKRDGMRKWLFSTFAVNNLLNNRQLLRQSVCLEDIPSGERFLTTIIESIRDGRKLRVTHQGFGKTEPTTFLLAPYCLKVFKQRWYVLAESEYPDHRLLIYGLDRFSAVEQTEEKYKIPADFDAETYFSHLYGVSGLQGEPQLIHIKVTASQAPYLRTLPIHFTQKEIEQNADFSIFEYYLIPNYEFKQELLSRGANAEVLSPKDLREEMKEEVKKMNKLYK